MFENIQASLYREYGLQALSMQAMPGGWSALAYRVRTREADYFLKAYDRHRQATWRWLDRLDQYMPAVLWLHGNTALHDRITAPLLTRQGAYKWEDGRYLYMLYPFIEGGCPGASMLTPEQVRQVARIIAELHAHGRDIPVPTEGLLETFDTPFSVVLHERLEALRRRPEPTLALEPHLDALSEALPLLQTTEAGLRRAQPRFVLCHTDIHGWNLMQAETLILIDWEGLMLAPAEADLFAFTDHFFFDYAWKDFMAEYRSVHREYRVHAEAMHYYRLRRRLEDIHEFLQDLLHKDLPRDELDRARQYLLRECALLPETMRPRASDDRI